MPLTDRLRYAVEEAIGAALAKEVQEAVVKEVRRAFREREDRIAALVRAAVAAALEEALEALKTDQS